MGGDATTEIKECIWKRKHACSVYENNEWNFVQKNKIVLVLAWTLTGDTFMKLLFSKNLTVDDIIFFSFKNFICVTKSVTLGFPPWFDAQTLEYKRDE